MAVRLSGGPANGLSLYVQIVCAQRIARSAYRSCPAAQHWFLSDTYLPYALGGGYVVGGQLVDFIARNHALLSHYVSEVRLSLNAGVDSRHIFCSL